LISTALIQKARFAQIKNQAESMAIFEEAMTEARLSGDRRIVSSGLFWMMMNLLATGQLARAKEIIRQRITVANELGDKDNIIYSHIALAGIGLYEEDYLSSKEHAEIAIRLSKSYNHNSGLLNALGAAGLANLATKDHLRALELSGEMERLFLSKNGRLKSDIGYPVFLRIWAYILSDDLGNTKKNAKELINIYEQDNNIRLSIEYFRVFAALACMEGRHEANITLTSFATRLHERVALSFLDHPFMIRFRAGLLDKSRQALGGQAFQAAWDDGQKMGLDKANEYLLEGMKL
jgi:hypothetical protein